MRLVAKKSVRLRAAALARTGGWHLFIYRVHFDHVFVCLRFRRRRYPLL